MSQKATLNFEDSTREFLSVTGSRNSMCKGPEETAMKMILGVFLVSLPD
jgi:hypothetical protein